MSGRSRGKTSSAYFKADPETLKEQYMSCIEELSIYDYHVEILQSEEKKELIRVKNEMNEKSEKVVELEERLAKTEAYIKAKEILDNAP